MARFAVLYTHNRPGLDKVIEADLYKVDAKFFTFLKDKEVVRSLKVDVVVQIRRMDEGDDGDDQEGDIGLSTDDLLGELAASTSHDMDDLIGALPGGDQLDELLAGLPELDLTALPEVDYHALLDGLETNGAQDA